MKTMKKILKSLPFQLLLGVIIGIVLGLISNEAVMNVIVTIKFVLGELINFCVPLIVIGFIAPSITKLGKNASRILGVAVLLAYVSSVLAALGSMAAGYGLIPHLSIVSEVDGLKELPEIVFQLEIPQIMSVMSALAFSILIGLAATWTKADTVIRLLDEFQQIVLMIVSKIVIPILPVFIALTFWSLAYEGTITKQLPVFLKVVMTVSQILYGKLPSVGTMILFCALLGVFAIGAPGVPGGTVMASLGLITGVLGFDATGTALMLTIFALQDSFGTACNVTGDGALTMILTGYARRHNIEQQTETIEF